MTYDEAVDTLARNAKVWWVPLWLFKLVNTISHTCLNCGSIRHGKGHLCSTCENELNNSFFS